MLISTAEVTVQRCFWKTAVLKLCENLHESIMNDVNANDQFKYHPFSDQAYTYSNS